MWCRQEWLDHCSYHLDGVHWTRVTCVCITVPYIRIIPYILLLFLPQVVSYQREWNELLCPGTSTSWDKGTRNLLYRILQQLYCIHTHAYWAVLCPWVLGFLLVTRLSVKTNKPWADCLNRMKWCWISTGWDWQTKKPVGTLCVLLLVRIFCVACILCRNQAVFFLHFFISFYLPYLCLYVVLASMGHNFVFACTCKYSQSR